MELLLQENFRKAIGHELTEEEYEQFSKYVFKKSFDKRSVLAEMGKPCNYVYFILKGSAYSFYINETGDKHAIQFALEGYWISDQYSFFSGREGIYTIETLEPTEVLVLNKENHEQLCRCNHLFEHLFRVLVQNAYVSLQYRLTKTNSEDAEHRYREFLNLFPHFVQRIPQYLIASYLGVKPQSLSRIRKGIVRKKEG